MKNNVLKVDKISLLLLLIALLILYLFPGSLIGYFFMEILQQPNPIPNPTVTLINHALAFLYLSIICLIGYNRDKFFSNYYFFIIIINNFGIAFIILYQTDLLNL